MRSSRPISRSQILAWLIAPFAAATLLACTQAEGETCQVDRDCESDLVCKIGSAERGICVREEDRVSEMDDGGDPDLPADPLPPDPDAG